MYASYNATPVVNTNFVTGVNATPTTQGSYVLKVDSNGKVIWSTDFLKLSTYDSNNNGIIDNSELINGHTVSFDVTDVPISMIEAQDDWDNI